ncbi:hypothetical protein HOLleu_12868 [Holothuria leucospilota]|uniref:EGF-like domain-containing protein n=1 Tax=Holothuria leucospilota TaxID=206669 RepID=A0A9Q1CC98_HOLLE|nr:hypothetical protein HOLleu_12868 [Holothuria leucospilota]
MRVPVGHALMEVNASRLHLVTTFVCARQDSGDKIVKWVGISVAAVSFQPINITCPLASSVNVIPIPNGESIAIWPTPTCTEGTGLAPTIVASCNRTLGSVFTSGNTTVGCQCTTAAGEVARCTFNVNVPAFRPLNITCPLASSVNVIPIPNGQSIAIWQTPTCTEGTGLAPTIVASCNRTLGSVFTSGNTAVGCQCSNAAGEVARCTFNVDVPTALNIACPASADVIIIPTPNGQLGVWGLPPCTQGGALAPIFSTCDPLVGSIFSPGENPVTCSCRSFTGEVASCTFNVDIPAVLSITCPASADVIIIPTPNGQLGIWGLPLCTQGGAPAPIFSTCDQVVGSIFSPGETPVTCSCRSLVGDEASCTFNVDIPVAGTLDITCPDTTSVQLFPITNGRAIALWQPIQCVDTATPNLPIFGDCTPGTGSIFESGNTMVDCSCRNAGDITSCTFVVNVGGQGCASSPCENDGSCIPGADGVSFTCECIFGFSGQLCENAPGRYFDGKHDYFCLILLVSTEIILNLNYGNLK